MANEQKLSLARRLAALFAKSEDPYAGAELTLAQRIVALMWALSALLALVFTPFAPPTAELGWAGWLVFCPMIAGGFVIARFLARGGRHATFGTMLLLSYLGLVELAVIQWLTGGHSSPFGQLYLLAVIAGVGVHPPRRAATLLVALILAASSPLAYDGWVGIGNIAARLTMWLALGFVLMVLMYNVRRQRVALRAAEMRADADARVDPLTGIGNRRAFDEALPAEISRARRAGAELAVMLLDVDSFKTINDTAGHAEGDRALETVAQALREGLRTSDRCFRWGGDEFAVLLPSTDHAGAVVLRDRVEARLVEVAAGSFQHPVELSWGVAALTSGDDDRILLGRADLDLMAEKARKQGDRSVAAASVLT
jgi:diguanylate cyclase (GGDEF)-like protein